MKTITTIINIIPETRLFHSVVFYVCVCFTLKRTNEIETDITSKRFAICETDNNNDNFTEPTELVTS